MELKDVSNYEQAMHSFIAAEYKDLVASIDNSGDYNDEIEKQMRAALERFAAEGSW